MLVERRFLNTRENPLISWFISNEPEFSKLNVSDRTEFFHLLNLFTFSEDRNKRNLGISTFIKHLQLIHNYICKGDMYDSLRGLICGGGGCHKIVFRQLLYVFLQKAADYLLILDYHNVRHRSSSFLVSITLRAKQGKL